VDGDDELRLDSTMCFIHSVHCVWY